MADPRNKWTIREDRKLESKYGIMSVAELSAQLGRTPHAVQSRARDLGLTKSRKSPHKEWSPEEDKLLRADYSKIGVKAAATKLGRSRKSVINRASALGVSAANAWSTHEDNYLRKNASNFTYAEIARRIGRSPGSVRMRAVFLGITTKRNRTV